MPDIEASTKPKPFVFVVMPFSKDFDDVYHLGIKAACNEAGAYCERLDEQVFDEGMLDRIYNQIAKADIIVADMSCQNPNVFYEVGYAHALDKRVILITNSASDIPFDLKHRFHIVYGDSISTLKSKLRDRVAWHVENPTELKLGRAEHLQFYIEGKSLEGGVHVAHQAIDRDYGQVGWKIELSIHNPPDPKIGVITFTPCLIVPGIFSEKFGGSKGLGSLVKLPDNLCLLQPNAPISIQPGGWSTVRFELLEKVHRPPNNTVFEMTLRVLSDGPPQDVAFKVKTQKGV